MSRALHDAVHYQAARRFNRGEYRAASRAWEEVWHALGADEGPDGPDDPTPPPAEAVLLRGLIRLAAGMTRWQEGRFGPALKLLDMGIADLDGPGRSPASFDREALVLSARRFRDALEAHGHTDMARAASLAPQIEVLTH